MRGIGLTRSIARAAAAALASLGAIMTVLAVTAACAAAAGPSWHIDLSSPTYITPGGDGVYEVLATNTGGPEEEAVITDTLPAGVTLKSVTFGWLPRKPAENLATSPFFCPPPSGRQVTCEIPSLYTKFFGSIDPGEVFRMVIETTAPNAEESVVDEASVQGDGASASASAQSTIGTRRSFGFSKLTVEPTEATEEIFVGAEASHSLYGFVYNKPYAKPFTQAGGHPWGLTVTGEFTSEVSPKGALVPTHDAKDVVADLPPGLLGDPMAVPRCPLADVSRGGTLCPADTQVGVYRIHDLGAKEYMAPIVSVTPEAGQSAEFALENTTPLYVPLLTAHLVRVLGEGGAERYSFTVVSKEIPQVAALKFELTFWGVPAEPSHDAERGRFCRITSLETPIFKCEGGGQASGTPAVPFLTMPTDCAGGPEAMTVRADSWQEPGVAGAAGQYSGYTNDVVPFPAATGCELLQFKPGTGIGLEPETSLADEPDGLDVSLKIPLNEQPSTDSAPLLRDTRVTLPEGMSVSSGVVDGIQACDEFGPEGINITGPESEFLGQDGEWHLAPGKCPDASRVGTAEAITPFLPVPVKGSVFLARPGCGGAGQSPCTERDALDGNLYRLYLELGGTGELADTGIEFKVPFETQANPATGQLTTDVSELVQAPYSEVRIRLDGGPRAPIANPPTCGPAVTTADLTPWSAPGRTPEGALVTGTADSLSSSYFEVSGCSSPPPFAPGFVAGTVTPQAGQYSAFTMNLSRRDREQYVKGIQLHTPPGLLAMLSSVPLCPETQANQPSLYGECAASKIGTVRVAAGAGSHPFEIEGSAYLTGPHDGAPFGLSIVTHAVAGPFNLGLVVVRARIDIDPSTSTATITTDETGPYAVPQIVFGVPLRLQRITADIDRPGFMFNPTNCAAQRIAATISGSQDATAAVSSPFAVAGCRSLAFKPKFTVATGAHTNRRVGASLDAKVSYPAGAFGNDANIARVKVSLPKQLPSRLSTLQQACPAATFDANPSRCPSASIVGIARTRTPVLPVELQGPVYFVSHGGEAFPSLIVVLQGDNVRVDLTGTTFINEKTNVTSSTFKTVPDVPVDSFELYLPQAKNSALAAVGKLCSERSKLAMPTEFVAQNGAVFKQSTKIQVNGCAKVKAKKSKAKKATRGEGRTGK